MVYIRGNHGDYDEWRQRGCEGWDWDSVLPYFKRAQNQTRGADDFHGVGGPLHVSDQPGPFELADAVLEACVQAGIPRNPDFNGAQQEGCGYYQTTTLKRRRWSTAQAYLKPARNRSNLVDPHRRARHARADREQPRRRRRVPYPAGRRTARAPGEIVVSGGAYGSPQLLLLSGLGPAQHLQDMGVPVVRDMPAVGSNLHDHFNSYVAWRCTQGDHTERPGAQPAAQAVGRRALCAVPLRADGEQRHSCRHLHALRSSAGTSRHPAQYLRMEHAGTHQDGIDAASIPRLHAQPGASAAGWARTVRLASADPLAPPSVLFDYLRTEYDMQAMIFGIRLCRKIAEQPALKPYIAEELQPGPAITSDAELAAFVRQTGVSNQHPTSSCAMGHGPNTVVDPRLRVHGIDGLRVADASIMPVAVWRQHQCADHHDRREVPRR